MKAPLVKIEGFFDNQYLLCPKCGGTYLHHCDVIVYDRAEDAAYTQVTTVAVNKVWSQKIASSEINNPSQRRDGLAVDFYCEQCPFEGALTIAQHKGETYIGWRERNAADKPHP